VAVLLAASGQATSTTGTPDVLAHGGVEHLSTQVDALVHAGIVRRLLALTECTYSNSLIEAWWRSLKHQWLFLHPLGQRRDRSPADGVGRPPLTD
jgi:putative transposase